MSNPSPLTRPAPIGGDVLLIAARDAARMLSVSERTLWSVTTPRGPLKAVRIGGRVLYRQSALTDYVAGLEANPPEPMKRPRAKASADSH